MTANTSTKREPLTRQRVLEAAVDLADREGIEAVTMRRLGQELGVEAMSLYNHVKNKEDVLDGAIEVIVAEIADRVTTADIDTSTWKTTVRGRIMAARSVMLRHPWAPAVIETRTKMTPTLIAYFDGLLGELLEGGFSYDLAHHAMHALGSRALGFTQELFEPDGESDEDEIPTSELVRMKDVFPNLVGMLDAISHDPNEESLGWCDDQTEFTFGIDLLLDGLEARLGSHR